MVREGAPSTTCSAALGKVADAGLRRHDDERVAIAPVDALIFPQVLTRPHAAQSRMATFARHDEEADLHRLFLAS
jgi:hypothetical protein